MDNNMAEFDKTKTYASQEETFVGVSIDNWYISTANSDIVR